MYRDTQINPLEVKLKETKIDIDLSNITATLSDINYRNDKNLTGKEFTPKTNPSTWIISEEGSELGIEDIEKRVSNMYQSLLNRYNVLLEEGTAEKVEDRKFNNGEVINTLTRFTDEEKAYDVHYDLQLKR